MDVVVAIVSDMHCGSITGLMPPGQFQLDAGGYYDPSEGQLFLWRVWDEYWNAIAQLRKGKQLRIVFNGDAVQGVDEKFTSIISKRAEEHEEIHIACMDHALKTSRFNKKKGDKLYYVRGTERHSERGAQAEERIAEDLDAELIDGRYSSYQMKFEVNGVIFDFLHKRERVGGRWWTEDNALFYGAKDIYARAIDKRWFKVPFDVIYVGSHFHQWTPYVQHRGPQGNITCGVTPAFQLMTGFGISVTRGIRRATIGAIAFTVFEDGAWKPYELIYEPDHIASEPK